MEKPNVKDLYQVSEIQLVYKTKVKASMRPKINKSNDAFQVLLQSWDENIIELQEQFKVILLNRANKVLGIFEISTGGVSGTVADPKLIFATAVKAAASGIILAHNHPSGGLTPSQSDIQLTNKIKEGGRFLEIQLLDHLIITPEAFYSFADEGLI